MRTISMARTTPAQNPRGFNKSSVLPFSLGTIEFLFRVHFPTIFVLLKLTRKNHVGQRKRLKERGLAAGGEIGSANGNLPKPVYAITIERSIVADDGKILRLGLRDQHAIERILVRPRQDACPNRVLHRHRQLFKSRPA